MLRRLRAVGGIILFMLLFTVTIKDCDVQTFRSGGKGGQNQNKVESGVRIIHRASGARGEARDSRDQLANKRAAFRRMAQSPEFQHWHATEVRRLLGTTEVSKVSCVYKGFGGKYARTYDFPDQTVKDHRTGHTDHNPQAVLEGNLDGFISAALIVR